MSHLKTVSADSDGEEKQKNHPRVPFFCLYFDIFFLKWKVKVENAANVFFFSLLKQFRKAKEHVFQLLAGDLRHC